MRRKIKKDNEEINFWQSHADMLTALVLVLLLIIALLILFLLRKPDYDDYHPYETTTYHEDHDDNEEVTEEDDHHEDYTEEHHEDDDGGGNGGGGGGTGDGDMPGTEQGEYPGDGEGIKSAVYVMLVDGETQKTVKEAGVEFELYDENSELKILNTYYPEKVTYRKFETTEDGVFYLPEKIWERGYFFRELTEAKGYDLAEDTWFEFDHMYDWPDPLVVRIPVFPSRNVIRIQMTDVETSQTVPHGSFQVVAKEDILTQDGTLRYAQGAVADTIEIDENGYGESQELYLGEYTLVQQDIPEYYASQLSNIDQVVEKKSLSDNSPYKIQNERTKILLTLCDELYENTVIPDTTFLVSDGTTSQEYTTNRAGQILLDNIKKDTDYTVTQTSVSGDYQLSTEPVVVHISTAGRAEDSAVITATVTNRVLRTSFNVTDAIFKNSLGNIVISLRNEAGEEIKNWTSNGAAVTFTDIPEGNYEMILDDDEAHPYPVQVQNVKEIQQFYASKITIQSILALAGAVLVFVGLVFVVIRLVKRAGQKKGKEQE